jgi:G3E family GTPase
MAQESAMIPTILLTGFLGAGKTTLLNRLIDHYQSRRTVLLVNEFGQVGIDGELLRAGDYTKIELNKGSLFCICVRTDFIAEVERIAKELTPDLLLIEATGLADTSEMEKMLALPTLRDKIELHSCICLVDPTSFHKIKSTLKAPISQVKSADVIILNKTDRVSEATVEETLAEIRALAPHVPILTAQYADIPLNIIDTVQRPRADAEGELGEGRPDPVISLTLLGRGRVSRSDWDDFTALFADSSMRVKGFVTVDDTVYHLDATPDDWSMIASEHHSQGTQRLVIIGQNLPTKEIEDRFSALVETLTPAQARNL